MVKNRQCDLYKGDAVLMLVKLIRQINVAHVVVTIKNDILPFLKRFTPKIAINHNTLLCLTLCC